MNPTLLVFAIEDDEDDTKFMEDAFKRVGVVDYEFFKIPGEFFAVFNENIPVVVIDYNLPGMNGQEILDRVKKINKRCRVIIASGLITNEMTVKLSLSGANDLVVKERGWEVKLAKIVAKHLHDAEEEHEEERAKKEYSERKYERIQRYLKP